MGMAVGGHGDADAGAADDHPPIRPAGGQCGCQGVRIIRIIHAFRTMAAQIQNAMPKALKLFNQNGFQLITTMIGGNGDGSSGFFGHPGSANVVSDFAYHICRWDAKDSTSAAKEAGKRGYLPRCRRRYSSFWMAVRAIWSRLMRGEPTTDTS